MSSKKALYLVVAGLNLAVACAPTAKKIAEQREKNVKNQYDKAMVALRYDLPDQAIGYLNQALEIDPNYAPAYNALGYAYYKKKDFGQAAEAYRKFLELSPRDSKARVSLGVIYEELGKADMAEAEYRRAYEIDGNPEASFGLAKLFLGQKNLSAALEYAEAALAKNGKSVPALNLKGVVLNQMGKYAEALAVFQTAVELAPNDQNLKVNLGIALINNREFDRARELFEKILSQVEDPILKVKINEYLKIIKDNT